MTEIQLYPPGSDWPFTAQWYEHREHAPHLNQSVHNARFRATRDLVVQAVTEFDVVSIVDFGCGDGGLLALLADEGIEETRGVLTWGYDLMPSNVRYGTEVRHVDVRYRDFLNAEVEWGQLAICTEVLEHLQDPHGWLRLVRSHSDFLIASSPANETEEHHDGSHAWCWDMDGYARLVSQAGYRVMEHVEVEGGFNFQVLLAQA
jgi:hypothetical protein